MAYVAAELDRGKVTRHDKYPDTASLVAAPKSTSHGYWGDAPTTSGGVVAVGSVGKFTGWLAGWLAVRRPARVGHESASGPPESSPLNAATWLGERVAGLQARRT